MLDDIIYVPALRGSASEFKALKDISIARRELIAPLIAVRGDSTDALVSFMKAWQGKVLLDVSRYEKDRETKLCQQLNQTLSGYAAKLNFFKAINKVQPYLIPVIGFKLEDPAAEIAQLGKDLLASFDEVAIRLEGDIGVLEKALSLAHPFLGSLSESDLQRVAFILDLQKIEDHPDHHAIASFLAKLTKYKFGCLITCSTSWPSVRPAKNSSKNDQCIDPYWQARVHAKHSKKSDIRMIYGDHAANSPTETIDFKPWMVVLPFAGYYRKLQWYLERRGNDKEYQHLRQVAKNISKLPEFDKDLCVATREIHKIATDSKAPHGSNRAWNRRRFNQHISAMVDQLLDGLFDEIVSGKMASP